MALRSRVEIMSFQSTSLSRGKTELAGLDGQREDLSIHFPLTREDRNWPDWTDSVRTFQSTSLSRGKTYLEHQDGLEQYLSIHFPLTREDRIDKISVWESTSFNPLPSHEGRLTTQWQGKAMEGFQSTSLSRGKTIAMAKAEGWYSFQSTSLSRGKTAPQHNYLFLTNFQSTSLSRGKTEQERAG